MSQPALWELVRSAAYDLDKSGRVPFTRQDLIALVQKSRRSSHENSINPIIQGVTTNLKGGAPGAVGKNILRSVGRNQFVLNNQKTRSLIKSANPMPTKPQYSNSMKAIVTPGSESELQSFIMDGLKQKFSSLSLSRRHLDTDRFEMVGGQVCMLEGSLLYSLSDGNRVRHKSDFLVLDEKHKRYLSIELKFKSSVTDQFKCRAYDALHLKREYGDSIETVMMYVHAGRGISLKQAQAICYQFDHFIGATLDDVLEQGAIPALNSIIGRFIDNAYAAA